eukprot:288736-Rhodomonas_salina.1
MGCSLPLTVTRSTSRHSFRTCHPPPPSHIRQTFAAFAWPVERLSREDEGSAVRVVSCVVGSDLVGEQVVDVAREQDWRAVLRHPGVSAAQGPARGAERTPAWSHSQGARPG